MKSCLFGSDVDEQDLLPAVRRALGVGSKCIEGGADADAEMETERCLHEVEEAIASTVQKKHYRLGGHGDAREGWCGARVSGGGAGNTRV